MSRLLLVDDDPTLPRTLQLNLTARGHDVTTAANGTEALHQMKVGDPELISRENLLRAAWRPTYGPERHYLRVFASPTRRKMESDPSLPQHLINSPASGTGWSSSRYRAPFPAQGRTKVCRSPLRKPRPFTWCD